MNKNQSPCDIGRELFAPIRVLLEAGKRMTRPRQVDLYDVFFYSYDAGKKVSEIKRHIGVPTLGLSHALAVTTANVPGGALITFASNQEALSAVQNVLADSAYTGEPFAQAVKIMLDASDEIAKRNKLHTLAVVPKRWVVGCSFAWREKCQRLWKNCERKLYTSL